MPRQPGSLLWLRRDLRLGDNPALSAAAADGPVAVLFVLDPALLRPAGGPRIAYLLASLRALDARLRALGGSLVVRTGDPVAVVPSLAEDIGAAAVHIAADSGPYGAARDDRVEAELDRAAPGRIPLVRTGSPYAIAPGRVRKADGSGYAVFTPFYRAWLAHGWRAPAVTELAAVRWLAAAGEPIPAGPPQPPGLRLPEAGEEAALAAWRGFRDGPLQRYDELRDRPDLDATSRLSVHLKFGEIHPRTLLADLADLGVDGAAAGAGAERFRTELAWREFYAAVLRARPDSAREYFAPQLADMAYDTGRIAEGRLEAWRQGRTGYPIVDAGMRQLLGEAWMHNRVRMIVASFLVKDLHLEWTTGARHFMRLLVDGDLASNQHGWQWTAGTGTDAAPYFRIFNPVAQSKAVDPDGDYIRRWVPELRDLAAPAIHQPWTAPGGPPAGYPAPIVDHATERAESLARYRAARGR